MGQSLYEDLESLLTAAEIRGVIEFSSVAENPVIKFFSANAVPIVVVDPDGWEEFLKEILEQSQNDTEKELVKHLLQSFKSHKKIQFKVQSEQSINDEQINELKDKLENTKSVEEFLKLI